MRALSIMAFLCLMHLLQNKLHSQIKHYSKGQVLYERKTNAYRLSEGMWLHDYFKNSKFSTDTFTLDFDSNHSIFYCKSYNAEEETIGGFSFQLNPDLSTQIYKNHNTDSLVIIRQMQEERIAIIDSFRHIQWKVIDEFRDIAGFRCQKYVGVIFDSVYVTAFVTDQILVSDGPESFTGLPGMVMGLAIPRLFTNWMAIQFIEEPQTIEAPKKMPKSKFHKNRESFATMAKERFGDWGTNYYNLYYWFWGL
jgi:GLPGLI family protein